MGGGRGTEGAGTSSRGKRRCEQKHSIETPLTEGAEGGKKKTDRNGGALKGIITSAFAASVILLLHKHTICLTENYLLHVVTREYNDKERAVHCSVWMQAASLVVITHYPKHQKKKKGKKKKKKKRGGKEKPSGEERVFRWSTSNTCSMYIFEKQKTKEDHVSEMPSQSSR